MKSALGKTLVIAALLIVAAGMTIWLVFGDDLAQAFSGPAEEIPPLTVPVTRGSVQQTVTGAGEVKPLSTEKLEPADSWHWLESFDVPLNKRVAAGTTLVTYANGEVWTAPFDLVVTSYTLPEKNKGAVTKDDHFIEVKRIDSVNIVLPVSEADLASLAEGQPVHVTLGADDTKHYEGIISNINEVGTYGATGSTFTVTVEVPNDGSIKLGMSANLSITVAEATDVLTVPVSAVSGAGDAKFVTVYQDGATVQVPVTTGISDGTMVEVSGELLHEGDAVMLNEAGGEAVEAAGAGAAPAVSIVMS